MFIAHLTLIFAFQFLFIAVLFLTKKQSKTGNRFLAATMLILAFQHFMHYMWATKLVYQYTWLLNIDVPLDGCIAPLVFFYIKEMAGEKIEFKPATWLHFWPLPLGLLWYINFNLQSPQFKKDFIDSAYREVPAAAAIVNFMIAGYVAVGYKKLDAYIKNQPSTEWSSGYSNLVWLRQFVAVLFFINVGAAPLNFIAHFNYIITGFPFLTGFIMLYVIYKTFNHPEVMSTELIRKFTRQLEYQREIEKVRRQISNDIHDELGAGLTQISMVSQLGKMQYASDNTLTQQFSKLSHQATQLMGTLKEVVWAINPQHDNLASMLAFLRHYISSFFEPTDIQINMDFGNAENAVVLAPYLRRNIVLIVKEACNNIIKHSGATAISFKASVDAKGFNLTIADNGKGLPHTQTGLGNGLKSMEKRVAELGGSIQTQSVDGKGLTISLYCPLPNIT